MVMSCKGMGRAMGGLCSMEGSVDGCLHSLEVCLLLRSGRGDANKHCITTRGSLLLSLCQQEANFIISSIRCEVTMQFKLCFHLSLIFANKLQNIKPLLNS